MGKHGTKIFMFNSSDEHTVSKFGSQRLHEVKLKKLKLELI
jgi:hypothetical protein